MPTVSNIRNLQMMHRNMKMRESSPEDVAKMLQALLTEAINLQNSGSSTFQKKALKELQQVRRDMIAGQISAGSATSQFVGTFSHVIDQIEGLSKDTDDSMSAKGLESLRDTLPSTDTLIAALMTANPLLGYGTKLIKDIASSRKRSIANRRDEEKRRLAVLREQEQYIASQFEESNNTDAVQPLDAASETYRDTQIILLEEIRDEIKRLEEMFARTWDVVDNTTESVDGIAEQSRENTLDAIDANREDRELAERNADLREMDGRYEDRPPIPIADNVETRAVSEEKKGGLLDVLLGAPLRALAAVVAGVVTGIGGVLAAFSGAGLVGGLMAPFKAVISLIVGIGKFALKLGAKVLVPIMVIKSIFDFFDGFFNAEEMLGQMDLSIGERILAGVSNVIAKIVGLADDLAELFGFDLFDQEGLTKRIYETLHSIPEKIVNVFDDVTTAVSDKVSEWTDIAVNTVTSAVEKVFSVFDDIVNLLDGIYKSVVDSLKTTVDKIPFVGKFFSKDDEEEAGDSEGKPRRVVTEEEKTVAEISEQIDNIEKEVKARKFSNKLSDITKNLMMVDKNDPHIANESPSDATAKTIQEAEKRAAVSNTTNVTPIFNAPTNVNNVQNKTVNVGVSTSNQNAGFRRFADMNGMMK